MKKLLILLSGLLLLQTSCSHTESAPGTRAERVVSEIHNPSSNKVLVACHRGDWRNWPENSLAAIESVIGMGADIVEIDLALTSDSVLVVCHDRTLNRTTTGKGLIAEIPYDSIQRCFLKSGHGVSVAPHATLREALELCKHCIAVNIDKGYQYYDLVQRLSENSGSPDSSSSKAKAPSQTSRRSSPLRAQHDVHAHHRHPQTKGQALFAEYLGTDTVPLAYEVCWSEYTPEVEACMKKVLAGGSKLWVNSLWPSLCGGSCDDAAVEGRPGEVYGKLVDMGATMIQTDRPELLISYLPRTRTATTTP